MFPHIIDRRRFLAQGSLGSLALALMLAEENQARAADLSARSSLPINHMRRGKPHFQPAAEQVLVIFCSGALSHVDAWDHKPELVKRHDQPLPGGDGLVTFKGAQGNLVQPLWPFKPRGESGKMISDLLPNIAEQADDLCFIHSMTAKSNTLKIR